MGYIDQFLFERRALNPIASPVISSVFPSVLINIWLLNSGYFYSSFVPPLTLKANKTTFDFWHWLLKQLLDGGTLNLFFCPAPLYFFLKTQLYEICTCLDFQIIHFEIRCLKTTNKVNLGGFGFGFYFVRLGAKFNFRHKQCLKLNLDIVRHITNIIFPMQAYV